MSRTLFAALTGSLVLLLGTGFVGNALSQDSLTYRTPPQAIADIAEARPTPEVALDPTRTRLLVIDYPSLPDISELSREELRLAGLRFHPSTNARSRRRLANGLSLVRISDGQTIAVRGLPSEPALDHFAFSPDGSRLAFTHTTSSGVELWTVEVDSAQASRLTENVNAIFVSTPFSWLSDSEHVVVRVLPEVRGPAPEKPTTPSGPIVQETTGEKAPARTYQDLLQSPHDAELFEYYGTSEVVTIAVNGGGALERVATPGIHAEVSPSPDGRFVLLETLQKPFSYLVPYYRFAHRVEVRDRSGNVVREMARLTLAENVPIGRNAVPTGPRSFGWRADSDATLFWVEAQDEGDPRTETKTRDKLFVSRAPFDEGPREIASLGLRFRSVYWGNDDLALVREWWWSDRRERISRMAPGNVGAETKSLFDYSYEDRYNVPGLPLLEPTERGERVLAMSSDGKRIFMTAEGASPEGNRPFLDSYDLETGEKTRLFRSEAPYYEFPLAWLDEQRGTILTQRESQTTPPNFFVRSIGNTEADVRALTEFPHPYPALARARRELVRYDRADGVKLTATLHLPGDYDPTQGTLPMLVWAYPREYKSADAAAQVRESPHRFSRVSWGSPLYWLTQGFAIMENATMPIVGEEDEEPNDSYVEQLVQSAQAAVDEAVRRGVADPDRVGIAGHSYGAFMTANLLAHSDIFRAGIARSGAFNRTLTPFGFQSEERTFWEAPEVYFAMSPFMHAHKVDEPILLIHGEADNNSGTFPIQSRRFYHALKGHGAKARLVMLPHESHGYRARESVLHTLWEMNEWLGQYVKNAPPRSATSNDMN